MPETLIETVRKRIEAIRGQRMGGQVGILETVRERIAAIKGGGAPMGGQTIVERLGERFPAVKRIRAQEELEPWERPALFERATKKQIAGVEVTKEAKKPALF